MTEDTTKNRRRYDVSNFKQPYITNRYIFRDPTVQFMTTACQTCTTAGDLNGTVTITMPTMGITREAATVDTEDEGLITTPIFK